MDRYNPNVLIHHGKKGQKWGVRLYQNKDGTLTELGKKRYARDQKEQSMKKPSKRVESLDPDRWVNEDLDRTGKTLDAGEKLTNSLKRGVNSIPTSQKKYDMDLSSMSDQELRSAVNRRMLEKQYQDVCTPQKVSKGKEYAMTTLEVTGSVLAIGTSTVFLIKELKNLLGK